MATYTNYYNLEKPSLNEIVDVNVINDNYDTIDEAINNAQSLALNIGTAYNPIIAYQVDDYCIYNNNLYKCVQATSSGDTFNPAKWQICKVTDDLGGTDVVANPSGSATSTLTKIEVDGTIYGISGGGGGSTVIVTPTLQSGTKVADIDVDGNTSSLYAPTPTTVVANPSGTPSTDLEKITIGSTDYNIPVGSTVVANPTGTSGSNLTRIKIDGTDYNIPSGGSGSSTLAGLSDVDLTSPSNGQILKYDSANQEWINANESTGSTVTWNQIQSTGTKIATVSIDGNSTDVYAPTSGGGGGGHTILDNSGTALTQRDDLQFIGAYSVDDSTNEITKVNVVREMTRAQFDLLSADEKVGIINVTDEDDTITSVIDGVFIDTTNVIQSEVTINSGSIDHSTYTYTATEDCAMLTYLEGSNTNTGVIVSINNVPVIEYQNVAGMYRDILFLKKGQIVDFSGLRYHAFFTVYGIQQGTDKHTGKIDYSTNEQDTGIKWIDGSKIYQKTIKIDNFGRATTTNVAHNINNLGYVVNISGSMVSSNPSVYDQVGLFNGNSDGIRIQVNSTNILIKAMDDWSDRSGYITIQYTKSSV